MDMVKTYRLITAAVAFAGLASAQSFKFAIGAPIAAGEPTVKKAVFVVRTENCADPTHAEVSGTVEGMVNGSPQTLDLRIAALSRPGVYAIYQTWPTDERWVVNIKGKCGGATARLIVPVVDGAFVRESAQFLSGASLGEGTSYPLTVHEWGTFTSVAGDDDKPLYWNGLGCSSELPLFVKDHGLRNGKALHVTTVRMETPVMYFYSSHELTANVSVRFPQGTISEWFPQAEAQNSYIEWHNIKIQPGVKLVLPSDGTANPYYAARNTDAVPLDVNGEHEKFLFYRGIGNFPLPAITRAIEFDNHDGRMRARMAGAAGPWRDTSPAELRKVLEARLIEEGLYPKEAQAMLDTWHDSWFEPGTRLIYIVPTKAVDEILPLTVSPAPQQTVRVFVGRKELISEATKEAVNTAIAKGDLDGVAPYRRFLAQILGNAHPEVWNRFACPIAAPQR